MMKTVAVSELKVHCLRLVDEVARHRRELLVTKRGKPVARLMPLAGRPADDPLVRLRGTLIGGTRVADFDTGTKWEAARR